MAYGGKPSKATLPAGCTPVTLFGEKGYFVPERLVGDPNAPPEVTPYDSGYGKASSKGSKGYEAGPYGYAPAPMDFSKGKGKGKGKDYGEKGKGKGKESDGPPPENPGLDETQKVYVGSVKTQVSQKHGYGFLDCQECRDDYGRDAFVHVKRCGWVHEMDLQLGETVLFNMMTD